MNINWNIDNIQSGARILVGGKLVGAASNNISDLLIDIPENIRIVINARGMDIGEGYLFLSPSQKNTLREIIRGLPTNTKFNSNTGSLFELAVNFLENKS